MEMRVKFDFDGKETALNCLVSLDEKGHLICRTAASQNRRSFVSNHKDELKENKIWPDEVYGAKVLLKNFMKDFEGTLKKHNYKPEMMDFAKEIHFCDHIVSSDDPEFHKHLMKLSAFYHEITSMLEYYTHRVVEFAGLNYDEEVVGLPMMIRTFKPVNSLEALAEKKNCYHWGLSNVYYLKELIDTFEYQAEDYDLIPFLEEHKHCTKSDIVELMAIVEFLNKACEYWDGMTIQIMNYSKIVDQQMKCSTVHIGVSNSAEEANKKTEEFINSKKSKKPTEFTNPNYQNAVKEFTNSENSVSERGIFINNDLKIHWAPNPDYVDPKTGTVDETKCPIIDYNGERVACNFRFKGTDDKMNTYYSRDRYQWYRQIDVPLDERENAIEDTFRVEKEPKPEKINKCNTPIFNYGLNPEFEAYQEDPNDMSNPHNYRYIATNVNGESCYSNDTITWTYLDKIPQKIKTGKPIKVEKPKAIQREKIYLSRRIGTQEKYIIPTKMVTGQILNWIYQQDPINPKTNAPVHEKFINGLMIATTKYLIDHSNREIPDFDYLDMSEKEFIDLLSDLMFNDESTRDWYMALNISYTEAKAGVTIQDRYDGKDVGKISFVSRFNTIPWENNFIDICALGQNVVVSVISELDKDNLMKLNKDNTSIPNKSTNG